jgi:hypothetical protein
MTHPWPWIAWPWVTLALLGAYHGLNPAMGWLFAVALGLQEKRRSAVVAALWPIAAGHATAITATILLFRSIQPFVSLRTLKFAVAIVLFSTGLYRLFRASHPRGSGMRVGRKDLFLWSFLMAAGHGAGLMLLPVLLSPPMTGMTHAMAGQTMMGQAHAAPSSLGVYKIVLAIFVHTLSLLAVAAALAILVFESYERVGLGPLKRVWLNFDLVWAIALLVAGFASLWL